MAREADLVIGIGTRYSDFTTASKTAFQNPDVRFININVAEIDAFKHTAMPLVADARVTLEEFSQALDGYHVPAEYTAQVSGLSTAMGIGGRPHLQLLQRIRQLNQGEVIGAV